MAAWDHAHYARTIDRHIDFSFEDGSLDVRSRHSPRLHRTRHLVRASLKLTTFHRRLRPQIPLSRLDLPQHFRPLQKLSVVVRFPFITVRARLCRKCTSSSTGSHMSGVVVTRDSRESQRNRYGIVVKLLAMEKLLERWELADWASWSSTDADQQSGAERWMLHQHGWHGGGGMWRTTFNQGSSGITSQLSHCFWTYRNLTWWWTQMNTSHLRFCNRRSTYGWWNKAVRQIFNYYNNKWFNYSKRLS